MSHNALQVLVGTALVDPEFCNKLLNGQRHIVLAEFDLTGEEKEAILAIEASSICEFAARLDEWLRVQEIPIGLARLQGESPNIISPTRSYLSPAGCP